MFSSDWPTNLLRIEGPFTILGSLAFNIWPILRAINVLPVPGGPYYNINKCTIVGHTNKIPLTWCIPKLATTSEGKTREAKARLKMSANSLSKPPIPICSKLKLGPNRTEPVELGIGYSVK